MAIFCLRFPLTKHVQQHVPDLPACSKLLRLIKNLYTATMDKEFWEKVAYGTSAYASVRTVFTLQINQNIFYRCYFHQVCNNSHIHRLLRHETVVESHTSNRELCPIIQYIKFTVSFSSPLQRTVCPHYSLKQHLWTACMFSLLSSSLI